MDTQVEEIGEELTRLRDRLCRRYQLEGIGEDRQALAEAIACLAKAEERIRSLRDPAMTG